MGLGVSLGAGVAQGSLVGALGSGSDRGPESQAPGLTPGSTTYDVPVLHYLGPVSWLVKWE